MRREKPAIGEIYHIYNRGVEKRKIFLKDHDRVRFLYSLSVFNSTLSSMNDRHYFDPQNTEVGLRYGEKLVEIIAFVLMPNHYHLMVRQASENGVTEFMRKLGTGYTNYFNKLYERVGPLFQGKYKAVRLEKESHFKYLPYYIHLNPLDLEFPEWRKENLKKSKGVLNFLDSYPWSSFHDYTGNPRHSNILSTKDLKEYRENPGQYKKDLDDWLADNTEEIKEITLEN